MVYCKMKSILFTLVFALLIQGYHSAQWSSTSPQDGVVIYACVAQSVTLPWQYILSSGDTLGDIQWYYNGNSQEMVAISSHGNFVTLPAFANRVQAVDNAGITVSHVTVADSGNYSVEIHVYGDAVAHTILRRSVLVQISDDLMTQDGHLHATQTPQPVLDTKTDQWSIQLQCGTFTFRGDPPFYVEWITPSGNVVNSSDYSDNHFNLLLTNPVQGGNFTCRVPSQHADDACLHGSNGSHVQASVHVDRMDARLSLLEKENQQLKEQLKQENEQRKQENQQLKQENQQLNESDVILRQENQHLNEKLTQFQQTLSTRVEKLEDRTRQQIGFTAHGLLSSTPPLDTPLIVNAVTYNHGNAYDGTTGYFTAPVSGIYFFAATSGSDADNQYAWYYLYIDNSQLDEAYTYQDSGHPTVATIHAVVHLNVGQRVYMRSGGETYYSFGTRFSGFLIAPDL